MNKATIVYTFRTYKNIDFLHEQFENVFVLSQIKRDIDKLYQGIDDLYPEYILGIAESTNNTSTFESKAVNIYNKTKCVSKNGIDSYALSIPNINGYSFSVSTSYTTSFCNYSMYKISEYLQKNEIQSKLYFVHLEADNLEELCKLYSEINIT